MAAGLSYRAIVELINSDNEAGLKSFLETRHANVDDKHEVKVPRFQNRTISIQKKLILDVIFFRNTYLLFFPSVVSD